MIATICFATNNKHKLEEINTLLRNEIKVFGLEEIGCTEELAEEQETLEGNSLQKAQYVFGNYGVSCFADDTGLEVEALNGEPGVYSARYAGSQRSAEDNMNLLLTNLQARYAGSQRSAEDNMNLLLTNLQSKVNRKAQFRTVITLITPEGKNQFEGVLKGTIIKDKRGGGGFGYDPIFLPEGNSKTLAEMSMEEKNMMSHRARAVEKLILFIDRN